MKLTAWLSFALAPLTALSVLAQTPTNSAPPDSAPPPVVSAAPAAPVVEPAAPAEPAPKPAKKHKAKAKQAKAPSVKSDIVLNPPVMAVVKCAVLDVRGRGSFAGEIITHLKKGDSVTVLEEITLGHVHPNEPDQWSCIVMPSNTPVWVDADFVDPETKAVRVKKVNLRGGPGENYSIVGRLDKGTVVKEISKKESWLEIETPTNAIAFVASEYLEVPVTEAPAAPEVAIAPPPVAAAPVVVNVPPETAPAVPAKPAEMPSDGLTAPAPTAASQADQLAASHQTPSAPAPAPAMSQPETTQSGSSRIVTREGFVHRSYNIIAPADFELHDIKTGELTEFLAPEPGKKFKAYVGTRVRIVGAESLDPRWPRTPILQIQTIDLMP